MIGVNQIFKVRSDTVYDGLFNIRYQLFLNDLHALDQLIFFNIQWFRLNLKILHFY